MKIKWILGLLLILFSAIVNAGQACQYACAKGKHCDAAKDLITVCIDAPSFKTEAEFSDYISSLSIVGKTLKQTKTELEKIAFFCFHLQRDDYRKMECSRPVLLENCSFQEQSFYIYLDDPKFKPEDISPEKLGQTESRSRYDYKLKLKIDRFSTWPLNSRPANSDCKW